MIGYVTVGTNDIDKAKKFYNPIFEKMGFSVRFEEEEVISWGDKDDETVPRFFACHPFDENPATVGNGGMIAFRVKTASDVDAFHAIALQNGGSDEGQPGFRPESYGDTFYVGYVRDPDGNKLAFACYDGKANP